MNDKIIYENYDNPALGKFSVKLMCHEGKIE